MHCESACIQGRGASCLHHLIISACQPWKSTSVTAEFLEATSIHIIVSESRENGYKCTPPFAWSGSPRSCDTSNLGPPLPDASKRNLVSGPNSVDVSELEQSWTLWISGIYSLSLAMDCLRGSRDPEMRRRSMTPSQGAHAARRIARGLPKMPKWKLHCRFGPLLTLHVVRYLRSGEFSALESNRRISITNSIM